MCIDSYLLTHNPEVVGSNKSKYRLIITESRGHPGSQHYVYFLQAVQNLLQFLFQVVE